ncbi:NADPH-dependent 2,4-dienoyl-CoA reductase, sulfur reductase [Terribacillus halophilus]|uniref:NADPH-dependent 2,4-dienoyl-CoA reductase, sulfur reductase n=1 Tax=Terribacillus halophilus TaxID=361279 RepID=A0A1G6T3C4_9BACI|nr:FAD-dependent oxidoreductase [Terribacillus halophilus]SDD23036.1 NADPH-dependent 2,4-dienoyl-CoA reductase, sulfur reductase [Terribacillus halophilus]
MKIRIIGSVAAGTSVAAKARRNNEEADIRIYDRDYDISYSVCGIPYFIGDEVEDLETLNPRDPAWFKKRYNVDIQTRHEVTDIDHDTKTLTIKNLDTGETLTDTYDILVFATGASPLTPNIEGTELGHVFHIRTIQNAGAIDQFIESRKPKTATIIGAGYIGLEMAEQLTHLGIEVTILQRSNQVMKHLDKDIADRITDTLKAHGVNVLLDQEAVRITETEIITSKGDTIASDLVFLAVGVKPNTALAEKIDVKLGKTGAIAVNEKMQTNLPDVYAVGDVAESFSVITGKPLYRPLGSTANKMGRIAGDVITGGNSIHRGILGTGIVRVFELAIGQTGLNEQEALAQGYDIETLHNIKPARAAYLGGKEIIIKAIADRATGRLLGVQAVGEEGVDKRIDVFVTAMTFGAKAEDLFHLDLAYAPPFSTTKDPVMYTGMALDNAIKKQNKLLTPKELQHRMEKGESFQIIDTRAKNQYDKSHIPDAVNIPLAELRNKAKDLDPKKPILCYCNSGVTGNAAQNILRQMGFEEVYNLSGGNKNYQVYRK